MNEQKLKAAVCRCIDENRDAIIGWAEAIAAKPELGFKEHQTAQLIGTVFRQLGLPVREGIVVTGVEGTLACAGSGPSLLLMGEMDAVINRDYHAADSATGAAHLCGHHLQVAVVLAAAFGLVRAEASRQLGGRVVFLGTPAEEFIEIEERLQFRKQGKIRFLGGKQELIRSGYVDQVDLAMLVHSQSGLPGCRMHFGGTGNGFLAKSIRFKGEAAHAGVAPHAAVNALNAACLAVVNIHVQRETFQDEDAVRVHSIITHGGDVVNIVPSDVRMETYVRGRSVQAIADANLKVDRALRAGADAVGAQVAIQNVPGYFPLVQNELMSQVARANALSLGGEQAVGEAGFTGGSTDMGDLGHLIPVIQPYAGGVQGSLHAADFSVSDYEAAVIFPAKVMAMTAVDLLIGEGTKAAEVLDQFEPLMSKKQYLDRLEQMGS